MSLNTVKLNCHKCGTWIYFGLAERSDGMCMSCYRDDRAMGWQQLRKQVQIPPAYTCQNVRCGKSFRSKEKQSYCFKCRAFIRREIAKANHRIGGVDYNE